MYTHGARMGIGPIGEGYFSASHTYPNQRRQDGSFGSSSPSLVSWALLLLAGSAAAAARESSCSAWRTFIPSDARAAMWIMLPSFSRPAVLKFAALLSGGPRRRANTNFPNETLNVERTKTE